jgi:hypothetical protein
VLSNELSEVLASQAVSTAYLSLARRKMSSVIKVAHSKAFGNVLSGCSVIVAIPVRNEEEHIVDCLLALKHQSYRARYGVVLLLNNCIDRTLDKVRSLRSQLSIPVLTLDVTLPPKAANAGYARRLALSCAALHAPDDGILMTTDADGRVYPDWIAANAAAITAGADAVVGQIELDQADADRIPARLHEDDAKECAYDRLLDQIHAYLDPDPSDPWPRHTDHSGASIAVTLAAYQRAGGIPPIPSAEDRAFIEALRRVDGRVRHAPEVRVVVSGRILGRAFGGMADTIRRRLAKADETLDERLEPAGNAARRAWMRSLLRTVWLGRKGSTNSLKNLSRGAKISKREIKTFSRSAYFGLAWAAFEASSPVLRHESVLTMNLAAETRRAQTILDFLLLRNGPSRGTGGQVDKRESDIDEVA